MKIIYKNKKIEKICLDQKNMTKLYGDMVAKKLNSALIALEAASNLYDIYKLPQYNLHKLRGNLDGIYSMYLGNTGFRLLIIPLDKNEEVIKSDDMSIYTMCVCVEIWEVSKHYE